VGRREGAGVAVLTEADALALLAAFGHRDPVRAYQADAGLVVDGVCGPQTRCSLLADRGAREHPELRDFRGSLGLLVRLEGHRGCPYWPGGRSGVTLDPGWDLENGREDATIELYGPIFGSASMEALRTAFGLTGGAAREWVELWRPSLGRWSITREQAAGILPHCAASYWRATVRREEIIGTQNTPARVQTALLSFVYNLWVDDLTPDMSRAIALLDWGALADMVAEVPKEERRRGIEAELIRSCA